MAALVEMLPVIKEVGQGAGPAAIFMLLATKWLVSDRKNGSSNGSGNGNRAVAEHTVQEIYDHLQQHMALSAEHRVQLMELIRSEGVVSRSKTESLENSMVTLSSNIEHLATAMDNRAEINT